MLIGSRLEVIWHEVWPELVPTSDAGAITQLIVSRKMSEQDVSPSKTFMACRALVRRESSFSVHRVVVPSRPLNGSVGLVCDVKPDYPPLWRLKTVVLIGCLCPKKEGDEKNEAYK